MPKRRHKSRPHVKTPKRRRNSAHRGFIPKRWWASGSVRLTVITVAVFLCLVVMESRVGGIRRDGDTYVMDMRTLCDFEMSQTDATTDDIPEACRKLDGKRVRLTGQMWCPNSAHELVDRFVMVYTFNGCCFGGPPKVQHVVEATVNHRGGLPYYDNVPVDVTGVLHVGIRRIGGRIQSVYRLDAEDVRPRPG